MNIDSLYNFAKNVPILKGFIEKYQDKVDLAVSVYKSGGYSGNLSDIEKGFKSVENELGMSRDHLNKALQPYLQHPLLKMAANVIAPGSANQIKDVVDQVSSNASAQSNRANSGDNGIASRFPTKFNF